MLTQLAVFLASLVVFGYVSRRPVGVLKYLPGPPSKSFLLGNLSELFAYKAGEVDLRWTRTYGSALRFKGLFGVDRLFFSDPKAMQHIYRNAGVDYVKPTIRREAGRMFLGRGIAWAQGPDHKRHRKILSPAFGAAEMKALMPMFRTVVRRMCGRWEGVTSDGPSVINVTDWLSRATLDIIGEAAFDYQFNTLTDDSNKLARVYNNFLVSAFGIPNTVSIFVQQTVALLPDSFFALLDKLPSRSLKTLREVAEEGRITGQIILDERMDSSKRQNPKDVLSLLLKANESESLANRLSDEELISEIRTIMAAGHETTSNSISFLFYELARHPDMQEKIRKEIQDSLSAARANGQPDLNIGDMEKMEYGLAFMKEVLRLYPAVYQTWLQSAKPDVIPLSKPIITSDGRKIEEISIEKGQNVHLSIFAYNRSSEIFGDNPDDLIPERWLNADKPISSIFGVYSNLGNFIAGSQACLGFRFATIELQTFMIETLRQFRFSLAPQSGNIIPAAAGVLAPVVEGEKEKGKQLPLLISLL
ncbi:cytochrome P450 [Fomitiporia mediterranea MF3/22]|uniref:cytochrome P450 n=1 Tax=Fomitiporia mediterranea (strain MF3/22) TaxID=694068 RepID=UPI00044095A2|nr:cytochrome P450 [Fomitiporia mediterranea MF3/22]EJD00175.1 cytochrome P450 [Fomitiporia mediterranea MF3/22]